MKSAIDLLSEYCEHWNASEDRDSNTGMIAYITTDRELTKEQKESIISSAHYYGGPCQVEFSVFEKIRIPLCSSCGREMSGSSCQFHGYDPNPIYKEMVIR